MKKYIIIIIIISIILNNCSKNDYLINGIQLYESSNEPYSLSSELTVVIGNYWEDSVLIIENCFLKNGKLFISLPKIIDDIYLEDHPLGGKMSSLIIFFNNSDFISLALKKEEKINNNEIAIVYYNMNASLSYPSLEDGIIREMNFKKGWNIINWDTCEIIDNIETLYAKGYKWYIME